MATPFKLKSGNASAFKNLGSSPAKQAIGGGPGEAVEHHRKYKAAQEFLKKNTVKSKPHVKPKGVLGPGTRPLDPKVTKDIAKVKNVIKKGVKKVGRKIFKGIGLLPSLMLTPMSASADDQPNFKKGDTHYQDPKKKIDFTKKK